MMKLRTLGQTGIQISPIGLGCWQFSNGLSVIRDYWGGMDDGKAADIVDVSLKGGINWFDTAEIYGLGTSEQILSSSLKKNNQKPGDVVIATKWFPGMRFAGSILRTIDTRIKNLGGYPIDLHQIHMPFSFSGLETQMRAMAKLVKEGKIRSVGVSNFSASQMRRSHQVLQAHGLVLASNQVPYSLMNRAIERNGVLETAQELGISIIAYSPLEQGLLSGRFHRDPAAVRSISVYRRMKYNGRLSDEGLKQSQPLINRMTELGDKYGVLPAQVALNWVVTYHGETVVAIPGATKPHHAAQNAAAMSFELTPDEGRELDELSKYLG